MPFRTREHLPHDPPDWVPDDAVFFITINCARRNSNQLAVEEMASKIAETIRFRTGLKQRWPELVLLMPDHLHALISFPANLKMKKVVRQWKRYTAANLKVVWQEDFFDHRIRNEDELEDKWNYIRNNPVRAGLVPTPEEWAYVWTAEFFGSGLLKSSPGGFGETAPPGETAPGKSDPPTTQ